MFPLQPILAKRIAPGHSDSFARGVFDITHARSARLAQSLRRIARANVTGAPPQSGVLPMP
jgi:hypothetical protein